MNACRLPSGTASGVWLILIGADQVNPPAGDTPPAVRPPDPGLPPLVKALVFFANLCFSPLSAIIALIVWLLIRDDKPRTADDLCKFTWIPFVLWILLVGLYMVFAVMFGVMDSMGEFGR